MNNTLAIMGGPKVVGLPEKDAFAWPHFENEEIELVTKVMAKPDYSFYEEAYLLEQEIKDFFGVSYALAHSNGTAAIHSALFALGIGPEDEVIVPSYTYWASVMPVLSCNARPIFAESDPNTLNIDPEDIERKITSRTRAIIVVHLCGMPCEMDEIMRIARKHNLKVVEDCAHCHDAEYKGQKTGTIGDIGCFSYQATKLLPGIEGGMMITNSRDYYERAVALGHYERLPGLPEDSPYRKYQNTCFGYKYRIHPLSAAILRTQLRKYQSLNQQRNDNLRLLDIELAKIKGVEVIKTPAYVKRNYYCYRLKYKPEDADNLKIEKLISALQAEGLEVGKERYVLMHQQILFNEPNEVFPWVFKNSVISGVSLPVTEKLYGQVLSLPTFQNSHRDLVIKYIEGFKKVLGQISVLKNIKTAVIADNPDMNWLKMKMPKVR